MTILPWETADTIATQQIISTPVHPKLYTSSINLLKFTFFFLIRDSMYLNSKAIFYQSFEHKKL